LVASPSSSLTEVAVALRPVLIPVGLPSLVEIPLTSLIPSSVELDGWLWRWRLGSLILLLEVVGVRILWVELLWLWLVLIPLGVVPVLVLRMVLAILLPDGASQLLARRTAPKACGLTGRSIIEEVVLLLEGHLRDVLLPILLSKLSSLSPLVEATVSLREPSSLVALLLPVVDGLVRVIALSALPAHPLPLLVATISPWDAFAVLISRLIVLGLPSVGLILPRIVAVGLTLVVPISASLSLILVAARPPSLSVGLVAPRASSVVLKTTLTLMLLVAAPMALPLKTTILRSLPSSEFVSGSSASLPLPASTPSHHTLGIILHYYYLPTIFREHIISLQPLLFT
jgi:hypothetical protein